MEGWVDGVEWWSSGVMEGLLGCVGVVWWGEGGTN